MTLSTTQLDLWVALSQIFTMDPDEMEHLLNETIAIFGKLRVTYLDIKASTQQTAHVWEVPDDIVFNLPDHFVERCYDMIDVMQMTSRFAELRSVQVGGSAATFARSVDQIIAEFHDALTKVKANLYGALLLIDPEAHFLAADDPLINY